MKPVLEKLPKVIVSKQNSAAPKVKPDSTKINKDDYIYYSNSISSDNFKKIVLSNTIMKPVFEELDEDNSHDYKLWPYSRKF